MVEQPEPTQAVFAMRLILRIGIMVNISESITSEETYLQQTNAVRVSRFIEPYQDTVYYFRYRQVKTYIS